MLKAVKGSTRFEPGVSGNEATKWRPGHSGNPSGKSKVRQEFEEYFNHALATQGSPEEAAQLLWEAARKGEAWAIQELCRRFAPETNSLRLVHEVDNDGIDYTKLTDEQIQQLEAILGRPQTEPAAVADGEGQTETA
jgi:hypothetical protein